MLERRVPGIGPLDAHIILIGEAPGQHEDAERKPFVGAAGWRLNEWLDEVGLHRPMMRIDNVCQRRPPANKIEAVPKPELLAWVDDLHDRLAALTDPWVIVPTGNTALRAMLGRKDATIMTARGFIEEYVDRRGRHIKVIPTIHPAATFRMPSWERPCRLDWRRIASDAQFRELRTPAWEHVTSPTVSDIEQFLGDLAVRPRDPLSLDVETWGGGVSMIGFGYQPTLSLTIPTVEQYWQSPATLAHVWRLVAALCAMPNPKVMQTGNYDRYWLRMDHGIRVVNYRYDCHALHHCWDATDDHDLGYMASVDLRMRGWKHIPKDEEAKLLHRDDATALRHYNGIDVVVQWQLADLYAKRLAAHGKMPFYDAHYVNMFDPLLDLMLTGIATDEVARKARFAELMVRVRETRDRAAEIVGQPLHTITGKRKVKVSDNISAHKLKAYLYTTLKLPKRIKRDTGKETADESAVRALMLKYPAKVGALGEQVLLHRRAKKMSEFLSETRVDTDGRMRSSYGFAPETGRLSSSKHPKGGGANAQNQDRELRDVFVPDPGHVFVEMDMSQAEDRIVKVLAASLLALGPRRDELLWRARAMPWENDEHLRAAAAIFHIPEADVTTKPNGGQRYLGKRARHAGNYDMHGTRLSEELLKDGVIITPAEGDRMIAAVIDDDTPEVRDYQREIRKRIMADRRLVNAWGRELSFEWDRLDEDTYRRGYAFLPQCLDGATEVLTRAGFVRFDCLPDDSEVAAWSPPGTINFVRPTRVIREQYTGPMFRLEWRKHGDLVMTPNHRIVRSLGNFRWDRVPANDVCGRRLSIPTAGTWQGGNAVLSRAVVQLLAATQADGCIKRTGGSRLVEWHFSKERKIIRLRQLLRRAGIAATEHKCRDGTTVFTACGAWPLLVDQWLPGKKFTLKLLELRPYLRGVLLREVALWDSARTTRGGDSWPFFTVDRDSAEALQVIAACTGFRAYLVQRCDATPTHKAQFALNLCRRPADAHRWSVLNHSGLVYCVEVPSGAFVVRRNGAVFVTGNSSVPAILNQFGHIPVYHWLMGQGMRARIVQNGHDSLLISTPPDEAWVIYQFAKASLERTVTYWGVDLLIPVVAKIGRTWSFVGGVEFKRPPTREAFEAALAVLG